MINTILYHRHLPGEGVFAGGDIASGVATVISTMGQAKEAAKAIDEYIKKRISG